jgi:hypothetical protein
MANLSNNRTCEELRQSRAGQPDLNQMMGKAPGTTLTGASRVPVYPGSCITLRDALKQLRHARMVPEGSP